MSTPKKTSIQIDAEVMKEVRRRAVEEGVPYSTYLENLIRNQWNTRKARNVGSSKPKR